MSSRLLAIALAVSVAVNLFALAAGATLLVTREQAQTRIETERGRPRERPLRAVLARLDPDVRTAVKDRLRASALAARPDFEEARRKRREAVALANSAGFEPDRVRTLLEESRAAELRGRGRLEADAVELLGTLDPADRAALSEILTRRGRSGGRDHRSAAEPQPKT